MIRKVETATKFKKDFKREQKGCHRKILEEDFPVLIKMLKNDLVLPEKYCDHLLTGEWKGCRDCHVKPDLILIYEKPDNEVLTLHRLGSHSELF